MDMSLSKLRVGNGHGGLACCSSWGHKESDTTEWLKWTELKLKEERPLQAYHILLSICIFYKLKLCGNLASSKSISAIFPTSFTHFVSLILVIGTHILVILAIFQASSLLLYCTQWSVIGDIWCHCCNCWRRREPCCYKTTNAINKCVHSGCSTNQPVIPLSLSAWASVFPETHYQK